MDSGERAPEASASPPVAEVADAPAKPSTKAIVSHLCLLLLTEDRVTREGLRAQVDPCSDVQFAMALHRAREKLRKDHKVEFVPGAPGELVRANDRQKLTRGQHFAHTATVKRRRAGDVFNAVDPAALSDDDRERLKLAQDKNMQILAWEQSIARRRGPPLDGGAVRDDMPKKTG